MSGMFLTLEEIEILTGFQQKGRQIVQLRGMGIPFFVNGSGRPIVTRGAVEGRAEKPASHTHSWSPALTQSQYMKHEVLCGTSTQH